MRKTRGQILEMEYLICKELEKALKKIKNNKATGIEEC